MQFMVIGKSTENNDIYFGGIFANEDDANARLEFIKENFVGYKNGKEVWTVQAFAHRGQTVNSNVFMVIKFDA